MYIIGLNTSIFGSFDFLGGACVRLLATLRPKCSLFFRLSWLLKDLGLAGQNAGSVCGRRRT